MANTVFRVPRMSPRALRYPLYVKCFYRNEPIDCFITSHMACLFGLYDTFYMRNLIGPQTVSVYNTMHKDAIIDAIK